MAFSSIVIIFWQQSNAVSAQQKHLAALTVQSAVAPSSAVALATPLQSAAPTPATPTTPIASQGQLLRPVPPVSAFSPPVVAQANLQVITSCNGHPGNANFRSMPSLAPDAVLGVVAQGQSVSLTGGTAMGDGELWYEAIAPNALYPSSNPAAQNRTQPNQKGWVASCFVAR